jgi:aldehyde dehydrogenase (NAD+)/betaine-aldehyde dehydrogenase
MTDLDGVTLSAVNPSTEKVFAELPLTSIESIGATVERAHRALENSSEWKIPSVRCAVLTEMASLLKTNLDELALSECHDTGKPYSQARDDVLMAASYFTYYAGWIDKFGGRSVPLGPQYVDYIVREPWGVCAQIIPWNYPLQVAARCAAPALACGNAVVLKPSEQASVTSLRLQELMIQAHLPEGLFSVVIGASDVGSALVEHPGVDHVTFVGSAAVGKIVARKCLERFIPVELEMGGKSPNIVFGDADLDRAVPVIVKALIQNAGQSCSAGSRLLIAGVIYNEVIERIVTAFGALTIGSGEDDCDLGPLISSSQLQHAEAMLESAREGGAHFVCGGNRPAHLKNGWYLEPTLIDMVDSESEIFQEEVFGPVLVAAKFESDDEAVRLANCSNYGLVAGIWTSDLRRAHSIAARVVAGQVFINGYGVGGGVALPFGGVKKSGYARGKAEEALLSYSWVKNVCIAL